jgi:hypothetical protein
MYQPTHFAGASAAKRGVGSWSTALKKELAAIFDSFSGHLTSLKSAFVDLFFHRRQICAGMNQFE